MAVEPPAPPPWVYQQPASIVQSQIDAMSERADSSLAIANETIAELQTIDVGGEGAAPPAFAFPAPPGSVISRPEQPSLRDFGAIDSFQTPNFTLPNTILSQIDALIASLPNPGEWESPIGDLHIPAPPAPIDTSGLPTRPALTDVVLPPEPAYQIPQLDPLLAINIPAAPALEFPEFTDTSVVFQGTTVNTVLAWSEPTYHPLLQNELVTTIRAMLQGDFVMPAIVEAMLFDRERSREDQSALTATQQAFDTWAGRGFGMPPGMLVEQVNVIQQGNQLAANERARDILTKSADWEIANLRAAISDGIQYETVLIGQFNNVAQRTFDAARARLDADIQMFQAYVSLFNAQQQARQIEVAIVNARIQIVQAKLEAWKTYLQGEQIKGQLNETTSRIYSTKVDALSKIIDIWKTRMDGARILSEINKTRIDAFKSDIDAYAARLQAEKTRFDAYDSQMRGVESQARIVEASARAFAATMEANTAHANVKISAIRGKVEALGVATNQFIALTGAERDRISAQAAAVQARASAFSADCSRYSAEIGANTEEARLGVTIAESRLRNHLAFYDTRLREYDQMQNRTLDRARIVVQALSSAGTMSSQLAAGAMSAMHVQASLSGNGSASTSWSNSYNESKNTNIEGESTSHE